MTWSDFAAANAWKLPVLAALLACSALLSGSETALFKLSPGQLYRFRQSGNPLRRLAASLMSDPRRALNAILLANLLVNTLFEALSILTVIDLKHQRLASGWVVAALSVAPLVAVILVGEVLPKAAAFAMGSGAAQVAALPMSAVVRALSPVIRFLERAVISPLTFLLAPRPASGHVTADELAALLDLSVRRGVIGHDANLLLQEIVQLTDLRAGDVMVPRVDMVAYDVNEPVSKLRDLFAASRLRRICVYDVDLDRTLGVIHARRLLLDEGADVRTLIQPVPFVPQSANLEKALIQFRVTRTQTAIVVDEFGGTAGLMTLEDVLEVIVGDIPDEHSAQVESAVLKISDREYLLDGKLAIHEWSDAFKMNLSAARISTVGGFVTSLLGRIPRPGDVARYRNLKFTVESMRHRRVDKLRLELLERGES